MAASAAVLTGALLNRRFDRRLGMMRVPGHVESGGRGWAARRAYCCCHCSRAPPRQTVTREDAARRSVFGRVVASSGYPEGGTDVGCVASAVGRRRGCGSSLNPLKGAGLMSSTSTDHQPVFDGRGGTILGLRSVPVERQNPAASASSTRRAGCSSTTSPSAICGTSRLGCRTRSRRWPTASSSCSCSTAATSPRTRRS